MKDDITDDLDLDEWPLKVISGTINGFVVSQNTAYTMHEVNYKLERHNFMWARVARLLTRPAAGRVGSGRVGLGWVGSSSARG